MWLHLHGLLLLLRRVLVLRGILLAGHVTKLNILLVFLLFTADHVDHFAFSQLLLYLGVPQRKGVLSQYGPGFLQHNVGGGLPVDDKST